LSKVDELEGRISVGRGRGKIAYVSYLIWGVVEERLWGIPREIQGLPNEPRHDEMR
jgi:hypothetical protein